MTDTNGTVADFQVDPELARLIPPLSRGERGALERSLLAEGCLDPLRVWRQENLLLDGHNRLILCREHQIPFTWIFIDLPDRLAAERYVLNLQFSRRNLSREAAAYVRGKRYQAEKRPRGGSRTSGGPMDQSDPLSTAQRLGEEYKIGEATIKRDHQFARAVDAVVANCDADTQDLVLSRDSGSTRNRLMQLAALTPEAQQEFIREAGEQSSA